MNKIIFIIGRQGSGKTKLANILKQKNDLVLDEVDSIEAATKFITDNWDCKGRVIIVSGSIEKHQLIGFKDIFILT